MSVLNERGEVSNRAIGFGVIAILCGLFFLTGVKYGRQLAPAAVVSDDSRRPEILEANAYMIKLISQDYAGRVARETGCRHLTTNTVFDYQTGKAFYVVESVYEDGSFAKFVAPEKVTEDQMENLIKKNRPVIWHGSDNQQP
jgi:hypothetical protein